MWDMALREIIGGASAVKPCDGGRDGKLSSDSFRPQYALMPNCRWITTQTHGRAGHLDHAADTQPWATFVASGQGCGCQVISPARPPSSSVISASTALIRSWSARLDAVA